MKLSPLPACTGGVFALMKNEVVLEGQLFIVEWPAVVSYSTPCYKQIAFSVKLVNGKGQMTIEIERTRHKVEVVVTSHSVQLSSKNAAGYDYLNLEMIPKGHDYWDLKINALPDLRLSPHPNTKPCGDWLKSFCLLNAFNSSGYPLFEEDDPEPAIPFVG